MLLIEYRRIGAIVTTCILIIGEITSPWKDLLFNELKDLEKHWRLRYYGTNVN